MKSKTKTEKLYNGSCLFLSQNSLSQCFNIDRRIIKKLCEGVEHKKDKGVTLYRSSEVYKKIVDSRNIKMSILREKVRNLKLSADATELKNAATRERQVPIEHVASAVSNEYNLVRSELREIAALALCQELSGISDPVLIQAKLETVINEKLTKLSTEK